MDEFVADLSAKGLQVSWRDGQIGVEDQNLGGFLERPRRGRGADRLSKDCRAVAAMIQSLLGSVGGKRLGGSASKSGRLLGVGSSRLE
jgi:hypothetical protein